MSDRDKTAAPDERSVLPTVARPASGLSNAAIAVGAVVLGLILFAVLESRRQSTSAPAVTMREAAGTRSESPPPLYIPPEPIAPPPPMLAPPPAPLVIPTPAPPPVRPSAPASPVVIQSLAPPVSRPTESPRPRNAGGAILVVDTSQPRDNSQPGGLNAGLTGSGGDTSSRARAGTIAGRSTTVAQGTLIPAVLETALNSSRPGFARALVQRDVRSFDGQRVLIPRGSRLIGEYRSDVTPGQKRALVNWTRLIRPDGVTIAIGSPSTDPVGTGGIKANVDTHFWERFSGAILQSALDVGVNLAARSAGGSVVLLPGSIPTGRGIASPTQIPPTLSVRQGTTISVFVARDLDFTGYDGQP